MIVGKQYRGPAVASSSWRASCTKDTGTSLRSDAENDPRRSRAGLQLAPSVPEAVACTAWGGDLATGVRIPAWHKCSREGLSLFDYSVSPFVALLTWKWVQSMRYIFKCFFLIARGDESNAFSLG